MTICKECKRGTLTVIGVDDMNLLVQCGYCKEIYLVEPDGLGQGGLEWAQAMADKESGLFELY